MKKKITFLGILLTLFALSTAVRSDSELDILQNSKSATERKIDEAQSQLQRIKNEIKQLEQKSQSTENQLRAAELQLEKAIAVVNVQAETVALARNDLKELGTKIEMTDRSIDRSQKHLHTRANALLKLSLLNNAEYLLTSADAAEMEFRIRLLNTIAESDAKIIAQTIESKKRMEELRSEKEEALANLEQEEERLVAAKNDVVNRKKNLESLRRSLAQNAREAEENRRQTQSAINSLKSALKNIQKKIEKRLEELKNRWNTKDFDRPGSGDVFTPELDLDGIFIRAKEGSPVKVSADGEILSIQELKGMGQTIIVGHGNNYSTVYANLSRIDVKQGQEVRSGSVIGRSGRSAYGEMFYFAIFQNGKPVDPKTKIR